MQRVLEPEYMDTAEEAAGYAAMDHAEVNRAVAEAFLAHGGGEGLALDLGTGPGDIPILIAQRAPRVRFAAVDAARTMLSLAAARVARAGLGRRIALLAADVKHLPFGSACFDAVLSNTILHHIPRPDALLAEAWRVRRPGGALLIRDLCRPGSEADAWRLVDLHAKGATTGQRRLLFDSLCAALTLDEARALVRQAGMHGAGVEMTSDRHYTIAVRR